MVPTLQPEGLASLLRSWNGDKTSLNPDNCGHLIHLAQLELGAAEAPLSCDAADIDELSSKLRPLLPTNPQGQTVADVFAEIRDGASRQLKVPAGTIAWDTAWASIRSARLMAQWTISNFLEEMLLECDAALDEPWELVGETVRWIWRARGGQPFWHLPPYERNWCPSQGIFYDLRQIPMLHQRAPIDTIEPSTLLSALISKKQHGVLLDSIDHRFGVWLGRRGKEGRMPLLLASVLASPLSLFVVGGVLISISEDGRLAGMLSFLIYGLCIGIAAVIYVRSQPRFPSTLVTVKDVVRAIVQKRRNAKTQKSRLRPIWISTRRCPAEPPRYAARSRWHQ